MKAECENHLNVVLVMAERGAGIHQEGTALIPTEQWQAGISHVAGCSHCRSSLILTRDQLRDFEQGLLPEPSPESIQRTVEIGLRVFSEMDEETRRATVFAMGKILSKEN